MSQPTPNAAVPDVPTVRAYLVDPKERTVREIALPARQAFDASRKLIEAQTLDVVRAHTFFGGAGGALLYVDDEGLLIEPQFQAYALVGNKVIAGAFVVLREVQVPLEDEDDDGWRVVDVDFSASDVLSKVAFCNARFAAAAVELGVQEAAAYYASRGLQVERAGNGLIVTSGPSSS
jgi:hypothetical protein